MTSLLVLTNAHRTQNTDSSITPKRLPLAAPLQSNHPPTLNLTTTDLFSVPTRILKLEIKIPHVGGKYGFLLIPALPLVWLFVVLQIIVIKFKEELWFSKHSYHCFGKCSPVWMPAEGPGVGIYCV